MKVIEKLDNFRNKQKKNNKLNKRDSKEAYNMLLQYFNEKDNVYKFDYIMSFNTDVGIKAFVTYLCSLDFENRKQKLKNLMSSEIFKKNTHNTSFKRGMALAAYLYNHELEKILVADVLKNTIQVAINTSKSGINQQIALYTNKEFIEFIDKSFFSLGDEKLSFSDEEYIKICELFIKSTFENYKKIKVSDMNQFLVLKWLSNFRKINTLDLELKKMIQNKVRQWPNDLRRNILQIKTIRKILDCNFQNSSNRKKEVEDLTLEGEQKNNVQIDDESSYNSQIESIDKEFSSILIKIEAVQKYYYKIKRHLEFYEKNLEYYKNEYKNKLEIIKQLEEKINYYESKLNELKEENYQLNEHNKKLQLQNNVLLEKENDYIHKIKTLHETTNNIEQHLLSEFKNRLALKLSVEYKDFKEIENEEVNKDIAEILKIQLSNIFKILKNQGIEL